MSMQVNFKTDKMALVGKEMCTFGQKHYKVKSSITCKANMLAMQNGKTNFDRVLSFDSQNVGLDDIRKAYRSMVLLYHPDVCPPSTREESTRRFIELQTAYETLPDPIPVKCMISNWVWLDRCRRGNRIFPKKYGRSNCGDSNNALISKLGGWKNSTLDS